ncbi:NisI/SpaI family lantibiotic immunity lipoprotein [Fervidibacillus halotolerans]|uniref:NisI/SpaI family lantibiotic immunity lipoprotein n=1 Tax=Fervidibacillus halotolerans TaxID=2980027 RepID=A0A9E8LZR9_9BACI|nr:NisI/SpaI family lantibiotic immunity lipoprotein [Fervidibacillus halotolerans]WAA12717.1 NisI/SpaI family lantibiotic immunity lipoprotein [Fervidibacillus halotolerans]
MKKAVIFLLIISFLSGCSTFSEFKNTAVDNMKTDLKLPKYELNKENFKEISYGGKTYIIEDTIVHPKELDEPIGKVVETITINEKNEILSKKELRKIQITPKKDEERTLMNFGWVYRIKDFDPEQTVAVVINNQYHIAKIKQAKEDTGL